MAASFGNAAYERLPLEEEEPAAAAAGSGGGSGLGSPPGIVGSNQQPPQHHQQIVGEGANNFLGVNNQNLMNSCQLPAEGFWGGGNNVRPPF